MKTLCGILFAAMLLVSTNARASLTEEYFLPPPQSFLEYLMSGEGAVLLISGGPILELDIDDVGIKIVCLLDDGSRMVTPKITEELFQNEKLIKVECTNGIIRKVRD